MSENHASPYELAMAITLPAGAAPPHATAARIQGEIDILFSELGLPARAAVSLRDAPPSSTAPTVRTVAGEWRCPAAIACRAKEVARHLHRDEAAATAEWAALCSREILRANAAQLITPDLTTAYLGEIEEFDDLHIEEAGRVLAALLAAGLSLPNRLRIAEAVASMLSPYDDPEQAASELAETLSPHSINIVASLDYVRALAAADDCSALSRVRAEIFEQTGLRFPDLEFRFEHAMPPGLFAFAVNGVRALPWVGVVAPPAAALEHMAACLRREIRDNAVRLVDADFARTARLSMTATHPALTSAVSSMFSDTDVAAVLRRLAAERVSLRNLVPVFDLMLRFAISGDRIEDHDAALAFVRRGLSFALLDERAVASGVLHVYEVGGATEAALRLNRSADASGFTTAVARAVRDGAADERVSLLTSSDLRPYVRALLAPDFPDLAVYARDEVPSDITVRTLGAVALASADVAQSPAWGGTTT